MKIFQFTEKQNNYNASFTYMFGIYEEENESLKITIPNPYNNRELFAETWNKLIIESTGRTQYVF